MVVLKRADWGRDGSYLSAFTTDAAGKLDILGHDGDSLGVDGAQVGVFEKTHQVSLTGLLKGHHGGALETQVGLEVLGNFSDQALERQLADQELSRFLVATDLTKSDGTGAVTMGFLDSTSGRGTLTSSLGGQLFTGRLATCGFTSGLLSTSHFDKRRFGTGGARESSASLYAVLKDVEECFFSHIHYWWGEKKGKKRPDNKKVSL